MIWDIPKRYRQRIAALEARLAELEGSYLSLTLDQAGVDRLARTLKSAQKAHGDWSAISIPVQLAATKRRP